MILNQRNPEPLGAPVLGSFSVNRPKYKSPPFMVSESFDTRSCWYGFGLTVSYTKYAKNPINASIKIYPCIVGFKRKGALGSLFSHSITYLFISSDHFRFGINLSDKRS